ncbi:hypothetical protein GpartN1_g3500.t1 [Galdieria partita]|uniref:Lipid desaturase domain-containing protein n=1 Tax=Galdieria partita TaxID=83374 RepID=A0A9C7UQ90_9RHOD|nr:hypothetical protein GpartN1_g3500.t1 [Galdieria partita]
MAFVHSHLPRFPASLLSSKLYRQPFCRIKVFPFLWCCARESFGAVGKLSLIDLDPQHQAFAEKTNTTSANSKRIQPILVLQGDTLQVFWYQRIVTCTTLCILATLFLRNIQYTTQALSSQEYTSLLEAIPRALQLVTMDIGCLFMGYIAADFFSGLVHWFLDNYGNERTPFIGKQCVAFQGHHQHPWTITHRPFCNLLATTCLISCPFLFLLLVAPIPHFIQIIFTSFGFFTVFAQQTHQWAHQAKPPSSWITFLQQMGILLSVKAHGKHHQPPFHKNYCIVSGICNEFLDNIQFYGKLEHYLYTQWGWVPHHVQKKGNLHAQ